MNRAEALALLNRLAKGIAEMFGKQCETLIYDLSVEGNTILVIYNGEVTGRTVGSIADALSSTKELVKVDLINRLTVTPERRQIKSSIFHFNGDSYKFALEINFDFTNLAQTNKILLQLMNVSQQLSDEISQEGEGMLSTLFEECLAIVAKPIDEMKKRDRIKLIKLLKQKNVFDIHKSVPYVSEQLKVSRFTIYNYLNEIG